MMHSHRPLAALATDFLVLNPASASAGDAHERSFPPDAEEGLVIKQARPWVE